MVHRLLGERWWFEDLGAAVAVEGVQEGHQVGDLLVGQLPVDQFVRVQIGVRQPAARHQPDGFLQGRHAAVVEVRSALRDVAEGGGLEGALAGFVLGRAADVLFGHPGPAEVRLFGVHPDAHVVELHVREQHPAVARGAAGAGGEEFRAAHGLLRHGARVAAPPVVIGGVAAIERVPLEGGDRLHHVVRGGGAAEDRLELLRITRNGVQLGHYGVGVGPHVAAGPGRARLGLERAAAAVPVELGVVRDVPERGAGPRQHPAKGAFRNRLAVGEAVFDEVAGVAGAGAVRREAGVEVELLPEGDFFRGLGVVGRDDGALEVRGRPGHEGWRSDVFDRLFGRRSAGERSGENSRNKDK